MSEGFVELRILDGDRRLIRKCLQEFQILLTEQRRGTSTVQVNGPQNPVADPQGCADQGADVVEAHTFKALETPVRAGVERHDSPPLSRLFENALAVLAGIPNGLVLEITCHPHLQLTRPFLAQEDQASLRGHDLDGEIQNPVQQFSQVPNGVDDLRDLVHGSQHFHRRNPSGRQCLGLGVARKELLEPLLDLLACA